MLYRVASFAVDPGTGTAFYTNDNLAELRYLEASIGKTGLLAVRPLLRMNPKDLWQIYMLETA